MTRSRSWVLHSVILYLQVFSLRLNGIELAEVELDRLGPHHELQRSEAERQLGEEEGQKRDTGSPFKW